ncbi:hypothetical protein LXL04_003786 [Taraxacum kok-saghyz]
MWDTFPTSKRYSHRRIQIAIGFTKHGIYGVADGGLQFLHSDLHWRPPKPTSISNRPPKRPPFPIDLGVGHRTLGVGHRTHRFDLYASRNSIDRMYLLFICYQITVMPSTTGYHNMYKEYRDTTLNGSIEKMCKRESTKQFHNCKIKFPLVFKKVRPQTRKLKTTYKAHRGQKQRDNSLHQELFMFGFCCLLPGTRLGPD